MKLRHRTTLDRVVRLAVAFDKDDTSEDDTFELPEDLSGLSDEDLASKLAEAHDLFEGIRQGGRVNLSEDDLKALRELKAAHDLITAEQGKRTEAAAAANAEAAELAAAMGGTPEPEGDGDGDAEGDDAEGDDAEPGEGEPEGQQQVAAAGTGPRQLRVPVNRGRVPRQQIDPSGGRANGLIRASAGVTGHRADAPMTVDDIGQVYSRLEAGVSLASMRTAMRAGQSFRQKSPIATIRVPQDERAIVRSTDRAMVAAAVEWVTDEARLNGGSLTAAGGWCAPSEVLYDLCSLESTEGIISLPTLTPSRGGLQSTLGPDWAAIFTDLGFCFTEEQDIAGDYVIDNEEQSITEGGAGLTSFTLTYSGQTTGSIDDDATAAQVQTALEALSNLAPGDVVVTGGPLGVAPFSVTFGGTLEDTNVEQMTATPTGGSGTVTIATVTAGDVTAAGKPCTTVPCPEWTDNRLGVCGTCIEAGILMSRSYPEMIRRYVAGAVAAHMHKIATNVINGILAGSANVTVAEGVNPSPGVLAPLLSAAELQGESIRNAYRMRRNTTLEAILPFWVRGAIRADMSRRLGVEGWRITDADIQSLFTMRGVNPQWVYNFDGLGLSPTAWPATIRMILYPAGTWVKLQGDLITLEALHDSALNANNNYTALFSEESWAVMQTCHVSRTVTVATCPSGATGGGTDLVCADGA